MNNKAIDINTENFKVVNGDITEEQIATWKGKYGRVVEVEVADTDLEELHRGYFHVPTCRPCRLSRPRPSRTR